MAFTFIRMGPGTKESGKTIFSMVKEKKFGQTIQCTKVTTTKERNMAKDSTSGRMDPATMVIGMKIE